MEGGRERISTIGSRIQGPLSKPSDNLLATPSQISYLSVIHTIGLIIRPCTCRYWVLQSIVKFSMLGNLRFVDMAIVIHPEWR